MTKKEHIKAWILENRVYLAGFMIPFLVMTAVCIGCGVEPFGDQSLVIIDGLHQYMPFFSEYHEKLRNLDSFFYSWNGGLGYNFMALWSYYLSSPLNLILVLFPKSALNMGVSFLIVLKISLIGLTTTAFLLHRTNKQNAKAVIFSTAFALSNFIVGYSWNVMWLDSIIMLPLILIGFDKMMQKKDGRLYGVTLALAMIGNFYIAFMICIFLVLWFLFYEHGKIRNWIRDGIRFGSYSLLGACMAAAGLLPAYIGIMNTASAEHMGLPEHGWFTNMWDILTTHMAAVNPVTNDNFDGNANLYAGMFCIFLVFLYLYARKISLKDKIKRVLFLGIFLVSFNETILNFIWHGFHDQYGIPNRFAFLYLFLLILTGFEVMERIRFMRWYHVLPALLSSFLFVAVPVLFESRESRIISVVLSLLLLAGYGGITFLYSIRKINKKHCMMILGAAAVAEISLSAAWGFVSNGQIDVPKFFGDTKAIEEVKQDIGDDLVRTDLISSKMLDEEIWHNLKCVTMFGSTANGSSVAMMDHLGFYTGANEYLYKGATPFTNVLMNVKYNIRRGKDSNLNDFQIVKTYDKMDLMENPYETAIGYGIKGTLDGWNYESAYPFRVQNDLVFHAYQERNIFREIPVTDPVTSACTIERTNDGEYKFKNTESLADNLVFTLPVTGGEDLYIHYDGSQVQNTIIKVNDEVRLSDKINSEIYHVGMIEKGDTVTISLQLEDDGVNEGVVRLSAAGFDHETFRRVHEKMMESSFKVQHYTSSSVNGIIHMKENGMVLFSIPYDEGWKIKMDGTGVKAVPVAEGLLGVPADEGRHRLELSYVSPGFYEGVKVSAVGIFIFFMITYVKKKRKDKKDLTEENEIKSGHEKTDML